MSFKEKIIIDHNIILYKNIISNELIQLIKNIDKIESVNNVWQVAASGNVKNNEHTYNKNIINLTSGDILYPVSLNFSTVRESLANIKKIVIDSAIPCLDDYAKTYEIKIKKIKNWTICSQTSGTQIHNDLDKDGDKYSRSVMLLINDDFSGGEFIFKDRFGNEPIPMTSGDILIYPTGIGYEHYESEISSGIKYTAISYFN